MKWWEASSRKWQFALAVGGSLMLATVIAVFLSLPAPRPKPASPPPSTTVEPSIRVIPLTKGDRLPPPPKSEDRVPEASPPLVQPNPNTWKPEPRKREPEPEPEKPAARELSRSSDICARTGGYRVDSGRSWRCVYNRHEIRRRRRH